MRLETALFLWHANFLHHRRHRALIEEFGSVDAAMPRFDRELLLQLGLKEATIGRVLGMRAAFDASALERAMHERGVKLLTIEDAAYPPLLREISDPPVFLSYVGDPSIMREKTFAVVGTRRMSPYGRRCVERFVPALARAGIITVSGLALGVDAAVAKDTMVAGGKTIAVLGGGLSAIHPRANEELARRIVQSGGLLLSEFPLDMRPDAYAFPARNRIIAGLCGGTLVIEAPEESGSVITAELALDFNRDVYAVPGQIFDDHFAGSHRLIASARAKLVSSPDELLRDLGVLPVMTDASAVSFSPASDDERLAYASLSGMPQTVDDLAAKTGADVSRVGIALTMLELAGVARCIGEGKWVRQ